MTVQIPLTQGKVAIVDDEDYERLAAHKWAAIPKGRTYYAVRSWFRDGRKGLIYMHREILALSKGVECDHADRDGLNNQKANLRPCTRSQNVANRSVLGSRSGLRGVRSYRGRWTARITVNRRGHCLGTFDDKVDAARAYDAAAHAAFGEFAVLNFPAPRGGGPGSTLVEPPESQGRWGSTSVRTSFHSAKA